jgi:hypothetical protein
MRIHIENQEKVYNDYWQPMQDALGDNLTEYIRHFLMREGAVVKQTDVYYALKENVTPNNAIQYLKELQKYSAYYQKLVYPEFEEERDFQKYFKRLNRIEVTTAYPLLLTFYGYYKESKITTEGFISILNTLENYLIRRFVCGIPSNQLNKVFSTIYPQITTKYNDNIVEGFKSILQTKGYPKDNEFYLRFKDSKMYGGGDRQIKTKLILETLEQVNSHKEIVSFENVTIEHVMPQTLTQWWVKHLGVDWEETHELFLHTIGNLTLTAYNTELSNYDFPLKKKTLYESHLELNKYFSSISSWTKKEIEQRSEFLAKKALEIWKYFGQEASGTNIGDVKGTAPNNLIILGQHFEVKTWRDVLVKTLETVADLEPDKFAIIAQNYPGMIGKDKNKFKAVRDLKNGYFIEVNRGADYIQRFCQHAIETIELTAEDWTVYT